MKALTPSAPCPRRVRKLPQLVRRATILGTGSCLPEHVIDNAYFSRELGVDTTPEWIESRIGIVTRHWAVQESSTDLAVAAARSALDQAQLDAEEIDLVVVATSTPDFTMPSTACLVQGRLGGEHALAFDIVNACAGFIYAFDAATRYLQSGDLQNALVIGVDRGSQLIDPHDRSTNVFFGDGAGRGRHQHTRCRPSVGLEAAFAGCECAIIRAGRRHDEESLFHRISRAVKARGDCGKGFLSRKHTQRNGRNDISCRR